MHRDPFVQYAVANAATGIRASRQAFPATAPGGLKVFVKSYLTDRAEASSRLIAEVGAAPAMGSSVVVGDPVAPRWTRVVGVRARPSAARAQHAEHRHPSW